MKNNSKKAILIVLLAFTYAKVYTQTYNPINLTWLQNKISQNKSKYDSKKLKVLLDTLKKNNTKIADYDAPLNFGTSIPDTLFTNYIKIYFNNGSLDVTTQHEESFFAHSQRTDTLNTHVPFIEITFKNKVSFLSKWFDEEKAGIGSIKWNKTLEVFWGRQIVDKIEVGEY